MRSLSAVFAAALLWLIASGVVADMMAVSPPASTHWTASTAQDWYRKQPWLVGVNYIPASAINQLEMWQAATFDGDGIARELGWARQFGLNTLRVSLHDLAYSDDPQGFLKRMDRFLSIASEHGMRPVFVLFDSCWDPDPAVGPQHRPIPGVHNSGWVQSPSRSALVDPKEEGRLRAYVEAVVGAFAKDGRVLAWDLWNEPDNPGGGSYNNAELPQERGRIEDLLPKTFAWARSKEPVQPLTSGLWFGADWSPGSSSLTPIQKIQVAESDVISFHNYEWPESFERRVAQLQQYGRPLLCTEWMARSAGSTVDSILPLGRRLRIGMFNWGLVQGKTQTDLPWDSWERPYTLQEPTVWFHDLLRPNGTPYRLRELLLFQELAHRDPAAIPEFP